MTLNWRFQSQLLLVGLVAGVSWMLGVRAERMALVAHALELETATHAAEDARLTAEAALTFERTQCDKMFLWYEYCLDERPCTSAGQDPAFPELVFWRKFPDPTHAHRALPGPTKDRVPAP